LLKIVTIIGARPQFIKASIVSKTFKESDFINETIIHTGQHFDFNMDRIFFNELSIPIPKYNLNINSVSHGEMTGRMIIDLEKLLLQEKPDLVLVYGDTNSTLAGALAAKKLHVKIIHVEAGLRSFNMRMPEEVNRVLTDRISDILFCPTVKAVANLENEGFNNFDCKVIKNGDVMFDLALRSKKIIDDLKFPIRKIKNQKFILCTIHREENTNDAEKLKSILNALNRIANEIEIILPLHPRSNKSIDSNKTKLNFKTYDPLGYLDMLKLLKHCALVITDSGGLQKEAFFFKKNCVTLREQTEWTELVENGFNVLAGSNENIIYDSYKAMIHKNNNFEINLYGNGNASQIILDTLYELQ